MIIKVEKQPSQYAIIHTAFLNDCRMSWKSKGILAYLLSKPNHWRIRLQDIKNKSPKELAEIRSSLKELRELGYAQIIRERDDKGRVKGTEYIIREIPSTVSRNDFNRDAGFSTLGEKPSVEKVAYIENTYNNQTKEYNHTVDIQCINNNNNNKAESIFFENSSKNTPQDKDRSNTNTPPTDTPVLFQDSIYYDKPTLRKALDNSYYEICKFADHEWYGCRAYDWSRTKNVKMTSEEWYSFIVRQISKDNTNGELRRLKESKTSKKEKLENVW